MQFGFGAINTGTVTAAVMAEIEMFTYGVEGRFMTTVGNNESMTTYLITDQLGSMRVAMAGDPDDSTTEVRQYINNHPFGVLAQSGGNYQADFRYTGHEYDAHGTFKFHYMGARYYDDRTGQFTGIDKAGEFASGYNYVGNDPIMRWDPDGNDGGLSYWMNIGTPYVPYGPEPQDQPDYGNPWDYDWWSELSDAEIDRAIEQLNNSGNSEYINRGNGGGPMNMEPITDDAQAWADWYYNWQHSYDNPFSDEAYQAFYDLMHSVHVSQGLNRPSGNVPVRRKENHNRLCDKERQMALSLLNDVKFARQKIATAEKERLALVVSQQVATSTVMMGALQLPPVIEGSFADNPIMRMMRDPSNIMMISAIEGVTIKIVGSAARPLIESAFKYAKGMVYRAANSLIRDPKVIRAMVKLYARTGIEPAAVKEFGRAVTDAGLVLRTEVGQSGSVKGLVHSHVEGLGRSIESLHIIHKMK